MKTKLFVIIIVAFGSLPGLLFANFVDVPLHFGMSQEMRDEFGHVLQGTAYEPGALVQILLAPDGIFPPERDGTPHPLNPVIAEFRIGQGTDPALGSIGRAAGSILINRYQAQAIFARVFNRSAREDSSFYTDSQLYVNSVNSYGVFMIEAAQTSTELDNADDDGDGLSNSWEKSLGSDPMNADTDGDGVSDRDEFLAGTDLLDASSYFALLDMMPQAGGDLWVGWASVAGHLYQLQATTNHFTDEVVSFVDVYDPVAAADDMSTAVITNALAGEFKHFRVKLVE